MVRNLVCDECGGAMQKGFIVETTRGMPYDASYWMEGTPEKGVWTWLKTKGKKKIYISAYRCERCGFLKFYAGSDHFAE